MTANVIADYACLKSEKPGVWELTPYLKRSWLVGPNHEVQGYWDLHVFSGAYAGCKSTGNDWKQAGLIVEFACEKDADPGKWEITPYFKHKR
jgi:hypothetical protein